MKTTPITIKGITYKVTYKWNAFIQDIVIKKIIVPIGATLDYNAVRSEVLHLELTRNHDRIHMQEEEREENERHKDESDAMVSGME
jgi:hypothetical protein